tara:strand:+ start:679 stop:1170 length:492 start_codon:yes stop_codon:yes gene_type:complete
MDLITSLRSILKELKQDDLFVDIESKNQHIVKELSAYLKAIQIAKTNNDIEFDYEFESNSFTNHCQNYLDRLVKEKISKEVVIKSTAENIVTISGENTQKVQREKLELSMKNLCHYLGIKKIDSFYSNRGQTYYRPEGISEFQSASNVIVDLSYLIASKDIKG